MSMGYLHSVLTLVFISITVFITIVIGVRFGFRLKGQRLWLMLSFLCSVSSVSSSVIHYTVQWELIIDVVQLASLATVFSAIAAFGVIVELARCPLVYTSICSTEITDPLGIVVYPGHDVKVNLYVHNCSKITANDVVIQALLPPPVTVLSIDTPTVSNITQDGHCAEVHFDSDRSYNPVHPFTYSSFSMTIRSENLSFPIPIIVYAMAKDMPRIGHTFFLTIEPLDLHRRQLWKILKRTHLPLVRTRELYFLYQRLLSLALFILAILPWLL